MRTAADYFGLMAYLLVMHGGVPDDTPMMLEDYRKSRGSGRRKAKLGVVQGSRRAPRRRITASAVDEAAA